MFLYRLLSVFPVILQNFPIKYKVNDVHLFTKRAFQHPNRHSISSYDDKRRKWKGFVIHWERDDRRRKKVSAQEKAIHIGRQYLLDFMFKLNKWLLINSSSQRGNKFSPSSPTYTVHSIHKTSNQTNSLNTFPFASHSKNVFHNRIHIIFQKRLMTASTVHTNISIPKMYYRLGQLVHLRKIH